MREARERKWGKKRGNKRERSGHRGANRHTDRTDTQTSGRKGFTKYERKTAAVGQNE